jgi:hypothetical protein
MTTEIAYPEGQLADQLPICNEPTGVQIKIEACSRNPFDGDVLFYDEVEHLVIKM